MLKKNTPLPNKRKQKDSPIFHPARPEARLDWRQDVDLLCSELKDEIALYRVKSVADKKQSASEQPRDKKRIVAQKRFKDSQPEKAKAGQKEKRKRVRGEFEHAAF